MARVGTDVGWIADPCLAPWDGAVGVSLHDDPPVPPLAVPERPGVAPPLVMTEAEAHESCDIMAKVLMSLKA